MTLVELNGECREVGYCDCGGLLGCVGDESVERPKHVDLEAARRAAQHEIHHREASTEAQVTMVDCGRCDRSHMPTHPHITNPGGELKGRPDLAPGWTQDRPSFLADRIGTRQPVAGGTGRASPADHVARGRSCWSATYLRA
jgi:hypothetical protein